MQKLLTITLLLILGTLQVLVLGRAAETNKELPVVQSNGHTLPAPLLKIVSLEFDNLAADFMFLKALVFIGSTLERSELPDITGIPSIYQEKRQIIKEDEWKWLYHVLDASTGLDPYFYDPYYFGNANLTWGGGLIRETNLLLEKGNRYRTWDWHIPFDVGFNNFYFLHDNVKASVYLMEASRRPGGNPAFASLASKLAYKEQRTENSISFLEEILKNTSDEILKKLYEKRLQAMNAILFLEKAAVVYKQKFKRNPETIDDLLQKKVVQRIPADPYNGQYYFDMHGRVRTTSESQLVPAYN
jgi:hypothetical protein